MQNISELTRQIKFLFNLTEQNVCKHEVDTFIAIETRHTKMAKSWANIVFVSERCLPTAGTSGYYHSAQEGVMRSLTI